jgi:hypothetical protein
MKKDLLSWISIVNLTIVIYGGLSNFIEVADWIRNFLDSYSYYLYSLWSKLAAFFDISLSRRAADCVSIAFFISLFTIGALIRGGKRRSPLRLWAIASLAIFFLWTSSGLYLGDAPGGLIFRIGASLSIFIYFALIVGRGHLQLATLYTAFTLILAMSFSFALDYVGGFLPDSGPTARNIALVAAWYSFLIAFISVPVMIAKPQAVKERVSFVLVGVLILSAMSEISKLLNTTVSSA